MSDDFGILILSCDAQSDLWAPFMRQFRKHFPDGDWPVYLGSNEIPCKEAGVIAILSGPDGNWSSSCKRILQQIPQRKLFVTLADLFLSSQVDAHLFTDAMKFIIDKDANHVKYWPTPRPDALLDASSIGEHSAGAPYRATICAFWDRRCFIDLLIEGEDPWSFEVFGSYRSAYKGEFYGLNSTRGSHGLVSPLFPCRNMIEKGHWVKESVQWAKIEGIELEMERRPVLSFHNRIVRWIQMVYFDAMLLVPWRLRVSLMNKLRKMLASY